MITRTITINPIHLNELKGRLDKAVKLGIAVPVITETRDRKLI